MPLDGRHRARPRPRWSHLVVAAATAAVTAGVISAVASSAPSTPAPRPANAAPAPVSPTTATGSRSALPVGFAQPAISAQDLQVTAFVSKVKGGVTVTITGVDIGNESVTVLPRDLGPNAATFRGSPVPTSEPPTERKALVPGEAIVYSCAVRLPDMDAGTLAFTVAGVPVSGQAAGD